MSRNLATIQKIENLSPIENADRIELAQILGWKVIVAKGEFQPGDLCLFFEIDSLIPTYKELEFLSKIGTKTIEVDGMEKTGYRIKTMRLKGVLSQGLAIPMFRLTSIMAGIGREIITEDVAILQENYVPQVGDDLSTYLDVVKYEKPIPLSMRGEVKGNFPKYFPKTDLLRIQNYPGFLERNKNVLFSIQEKVDGQSLSVYLKDDEFGVCSRNLELKDNDHDSRWTVVKALDIENKLRDGRARGLFNNICLQGEFVGKDVQGNRLNLPNRTILFFDAFNIDDQRYYDIDVFYRFRNELQLNAVSLYNINTIIGDNTIDTLVNMAIGNSLVNQSVQREGIVFKAQKESVDKETGRMCFKVINPEYLLKNDE